MKDALLIFGNAYLLIGVALLCYLLHPYAAHAEYLNEVLRKPKNQTCNKVVAFILVAIALVFLWPMFGFIGSSDRKKLHKNSK